MSGPVRHYGPSRVIGLPAHASCAVVGPTFAPGYPWNLIRLGEKLARREPVAVSLRREPDNTVDPNAVAVIDDSTGDLLGHLPKGVAGRLAPLLDAGEDWEVADPTVNTIEYKPGQPGLRVRLRRLSQADSAPARIGPDDLAELYVRIAALGPAIQEELARRWQHSRLADVGLAELRAEQLRYALSLVAGFEGQARRGGVDIEGGRQAARRRLAERGPLVEAASAP